jgi:hypothetical protein
MLIKFFPNGKGAGAGPVGYLVAERVLAYDGNRDLVRDADGQPLVVTRDPLPEVLRGNPSRTAALIDASRHQWTYRAGVISFAAEDAPSEAQQAEVMDVFEQLAFAGLDGEQYDMLWVRHSHEDRVELHFCTPRLELTTGKSLNIAPPGYQHAYDSLRDLMNQRHGWADPLDTERLQEVRDTTEAPTRAQGRDELHAWVLDQVSMGLITDRASMIDALTDAGFNLPRAGKAYITAEDPETGERWRLKGEIFHEDWHAAPAEREVERGTRDDQSRSRRLDAVPAGELQDRFQRYCDQRVAYHQDRYPVFSERQSERIAEPERDDPALADDLALGDRGDDHRLDRLDDGGELALDDPSDCAATERPRRHADRPGGAELVDAGPGPHRAEDLHSGRNAGDLHRNRGEMNDDTPDSLGARLARLRRAVGDGLRSFSEKLDRLGGALDAEDRRAAELIVRMRDLAAQVADRVHGCLAGLAERRGKLQRATDAAERKLGASESRREEAETELRHREPGLRH